MLKIFGKARCHPDKFPQLLSGRKVPFLDQALPTIARGPNEAVADCHNSHNPQRLFKISRFLGAATING